MVSSKEVSQGHLELAEEDRNKPFFKSDNRKIFWKKKNSASLKQVLYCYKTQLVFTALTKHWQFHSDSNGSFKLRLKHRDIFLDKWISHQFVADKTEFVLFAIITTNSNVLLISVIAIAP